MSRVDKMTAIPLVVLMDLTEFVTVTVAAAVVLLLGVILFIAGMLAPQSTGNKRRSTQPRPNPPKGQGGTCEICGHDDSSHTDASRRCCEYVAGLKAMVEEFGVPDPSQAPQTPAADPEVVREALSQHRQGQSRPSTELLNEIRSRVADKEG